LHRLAALFHCDLHHLFEKPGAPLPETINKPPTISPNIGFRIAELRAQCGMLQADLASALGISKYTVGDIERRVHRPRMVYLHRLAALFCCDLRHLLEEPGAPLPETIRKPTTIVNPNIGSRIGELRRHRGMLQTDLAHALDITRGQINNIEHRQRTHFRMSEIETLAALFHCEPRYLLDPPGAPLPETIPAALPTIGPNIGLRIAELRRHCGMRQDHVASALGITSSWLCNIEHRRGNRRRTRRRTLDTSQIEILATLFHCEPHHLLEEPGAPLPAPPPTFTDHVRVFREWQAKELREWSARSRSKNGTKGALHTARRILAKEPDIRLDDLQALLHGEGFEISKPALAACACHFRANYAAIREAGLLLCND